MQERRLVPFLTIFLAAFFASLPTSRADDCSDRFVPDRPGATNSHMTVGMGCVHVDSSVWMTRGPEATSVSFPHLLRVGLADMLELRFAQDIIGLSIPDTGDSLPTPGSSLYELKWTAFAADERTPGLGASFGVAVPGEDVRGATVTPVTTLLFDWSFASRLGLSLNGVWSTPPSDQAMQRSPRLAYGAVVSYGPPVEGDWLGLFVDASGGSLLVNGEYEQTAGAGASFLVRPNLALDVSFSLVVTGDDHPVSFGPGLAWRI